MRELILKMFMSLDGFVGSTDGNLGALMPPPDPWGRPGTQRGRGTPACMSWAAARSRCGPAIGRSRPTCSPPR
jgi:hypothetical protein